MTDDNSSQNEAARLQAVALLRNNVCEIQFTKRDGSLRVLKGTLLPTLLPEQTDVEEVTEGQKSKSVRGNQSNVVVYDLEAQGWRTFNVERLQSITPMVWKFENVNA